MRQDDFLFYECTCIGPVTIKAWNAPFTHYHYNRAKKYANISTKYQ